MQIASKLLTIISDHLIVHCCSFWDIHYFLSPVSSELFNYSGYITLIHIFKYEAYAVIHIQNLRSI